MKRQEARLLFAALALPGSIELALAQLEDGEEPDETAVAEYAWDIAEAMLQAAPAGAFTDQPPTLRRTRQGKTTR